jgi:transposase
VAQWLQAHPGVEVLVRDRAAAYAEAARLGAPTACQVADRFQLRQHVAAVLTHVFTTQAPQLARVNAQLLAQSPALAEAVALAQDCASLVRQRQPTQLEPWLIRAATSALTPFRRLAKGLRADAAAVQAAVTLPWSQGPIEGQINRLKMRKRQRCGRARLDLRARRFLLAA